MVQQAQSAQENHLLQSSGMKEVRVIDSGKDRLNKNESSSRKKNTVNEDDEGIDIVIQGNSDSKSKKLSKHDETSGSKGDHKSKDSKDGKSGKKNKGNTQGSGGSMVPPVVGNFFGGIMRDLSFRNESGMNKLLVWFAILLYCGLAVYAIFVTLELSPLEFDLTSSNVASSFSESGPSTSIAPGAEDIGGNQGSEHSSKSADKDMGGSGSGGNGDDDEGGMGGID